MFVKDQILSSVDMFCLPNIDFLSNFFQKIQIFVKKPKFLSQIQIFVKNPNLCQKSEMFVKNQIFCQKIKILWFR